MLTITNVRGVQTESVSTQHLELFKDFVEVLPSSVVLVFHNRRREVRVVILSPHIQ
jgi:hypothetical protein